MNKNNLTKINVFKEITKLFHQGVDDCEIIYTVSLEFGVSELMIKKRLALMREIEKNRRNKKQ